MTVLLLACHASFCENKKHSQLRAAELGFCRCGSSLGLSGGSSSPGTLGRGRSWSVLLLNSTKNPCTHTESPFLAAEDTHREERPNQLRAARFLSQFSPGLPLPALCWQPRGLLPPKSLCRGFRAALVGRLHVGGPLRIVSVLPSLFSDYVHSWISG